MSAPFAFLFAPPLFSSLARPRARFDFARARNRSLRLLVILAGCLVPIGGPLAGLANSARAQQPAQQPSWAVEIAPGSECANDPDFRERLTAQIPERQRAQLGAAELRARVLVGQNHTASLSVYDQLTQREAGQREISLPRGGCVAASEALALVIAVMVEAGRTVLPASEPASSNPPPPPPPPPPPTEPEKRARERERPVYVRPERHAWQGPPAGHDLTLQAGTNIGLLPQGNVAGTFGWGIRSARLWPIWLIGTVWLGLPDGDARARIGAAHGTLATCPIYWEKSVFRTRICPGLGAGAAWAEGRHLAPYGSTLTAISMASLNGAAHVRLAGPLELIVEARLEAQLVRLRFVYLRSDGAIPQVHQSQVITGSFFGGLGLRFR